MVQINPFSYVRPVKTATGITFLLGRWTVDSLQTIGELTLLLRQVVIALIWDRQRREVIATQLYHIGYLSLPVVLVAGMSIGLVMGVQAYSTLVKFNAAVMSGPMVNYSLCTQLIPVVTGLMVAGRVGSNMAAELGTMKVTEQLDALRTMGTDPVAYLVAPRFLACVLLMPMLTAIGAFAGVFAASFFLIHIWQVDGGAYWFQTSQYIRAWDIWTGFAKTVIFGGIISLVACRRGLMTRGGATGVGEACTHGVVQASIMLLIANFLMTLMLNKIYHLLHPN